MSTVVFTKTKASAIMPTKKYNRDAGYDLYVPHDFESISLKPTESIKIDTGIRVDLPINTVMLVHDKSSKGIHYRPCASVVDSGYTGNIHLSIQNCSGSPVRIDPGMALAQGIILALPQYNVVFKNVFDNALFEENVIESEERGERSSGFDNSK